MTKLSAEQAIDLALHHHTVGRLHEAEKIYRQILAADPNHVDALHFLGVLAHQGGKHEDSIKWIKRAIELGAGADAWNNLGEPLRALDRRDEALEAYRKALELEPDNAEALTNFGLMLLEERKYAEAAQHLQKAIAINPSLFGTKLPYDTKKDFTPVSLLARTSLLLVVSESLPVSNVKELVALAKSKPGALSMATAGLGTAVHLGCEQFRQEASIDVVPVPYRGGGPTMQDLIGGQIDLACLEASSGLAYVQAGKFKAYAVMSDRRWP